MSTLLPFRGGMTVVAAILLTAISSPVHGGTLYGGGRNGELLTIDEMTGVGTLVCSLPSMTTEIEYDNLFGTAFMQFPDGTFAGQSFDIDTCAGGPVVSDAHSFTGLEYVGITLYGTSIDFSGGPSELRTLDPTTGSSVLIGATGVGPIAGLAYDTSAGVMYGIAGGGGPANLYTINLTTGVATVVGSTGMQAGSLQFGNLGKLYAGGTGANAGELWRIDPATGAGTLVGATGISSGLTGLTFRGIPAVAIGVSPTKLIVVDKLATASKAKAVFVAKDPAITKGTGTNQATIGVEFTAAYANGSATGAFVLPVGDAGWLANNSTVAKFVNKTAPSGTTETKVSIIKPGKLVKLVGKGLGDTDFDILAAGDPAGDVYTAYCVTNDGAETCFCSTLNGCVYKSIAGNSGAKLVCKAGAGNAACAALFP